MKIQIINGPNLNLLGVREPSIYGNHSFESYLPQLRAKYPDITIEYYQSNIEGELIDKIQEVGFDDELWRHGIPFILLDYRVKATKNQRKTRAGRPLSVKMSHL